MIPEQLLAECTEALDKGADFPTVWREILRIHPLTAGKAMEKAEGSGISLEVPLTTGQRLVYHHESGFRLFGCAAVTL